jgi:hypothetical protein
MFQLAVTEGVHDKRVIDYLKNQKELQEGEDFIRTPDKGGEGTVNYSFPGMEEDNFRYIAIQLKRNGVNLGLVDKQLTEKKIMKLADLIKEWEEIPTNNSDEKPKLFPPGENGFVDIVQALEKLIDSWKSKYVGGWYTDEKNRADDYQLDISELLEIYKDKVPNTAKGEMGDYGEKDGAHLNEQKVRKLIRKTLRK